MTHVAPRDDSEPAVLPHRPDRAVLAVGVGVVALGAVVGWEAWRVSGRLVRYGISPYVVPALVAVVLVGLGIGILVAGLRGTFPERDKDEIGPILWIVAGVVAQLLLLRTAGFSVATGLLFAATARSMGRGPLWLTIPVGVAISLAIWVIFTQLLSLSLPAGPIETTVLSLLRRLHP